jgi:hypothetical protein
VANVRNLTLIKCAPGRRMSSVIHVPTVDVPGTGVPAAGLGQRYMTVARVRFANELTAARIQSKTTDLPYIASAPSHERRP